MTATQAVALYRRLIDQEHMSADDAAAVVDQAIADDIAATNRAIDAKWLRYDQREEDEHIYNEMVREGLR